MTADSTPARPDHPDRRSLADLVFVLSLVVAVPVIRYANRAQWFAGDEWALTLEKHLTDPSSMLERQNGHITTLPAVLYRLIFSVVGFHHYWPYQALAIAAHIGIVVILRVVMLRAGVERWIATTAAVVVLFFGSGSQNMATGFQITLTGAVLFGLLMLLAADHDGPLTHRDALAVLCGFAAVACSASAVPMLVAVGLMAAIRRGLLVAIALVGPPGLLFLGWNLFVPTDQPAPDRGTFASTVRFARALWFDSFEAIGNHAVVGAILLGVLVAGWVLVAAAGRSGEIELGRLVPPASLLVAAVAMVVTIGVARSAPTLLGSGPSSLARYLYLVTVLVIPGLAVAMSELARRWRPATAVAIVLLLVGLPANAQRLGLAEDNAEVGDEALLLHIADLAVEMGPPDDMRLVIPRGSGIRLTVGGLRDARIAGLVPDPLQGTDEQRRLAFLTLLLAPSADVRTADCEEVASGDPFVVTEGERIVLDGPSPVHVRRVVDGEPEPESRVPLTLVSPYAVQITWGPAEIVVDAEPDTSIRHCPAPPS